MKSVYDNFRRVTRLWRAITIEYRSGQAHGIDSLIPTQPKGNLIVYCGACPEPGFNSEKEPNRNPYHLRSGIIMSTSLSVSYVYSLVGDHVMQQKRTEIEHEILFLPSDFDATMQRDLGVFALGAEEGKLREGEAFDALESTRNACKGIVAMRDRHVKHDKGVGDNTRASKMLKSSEQLRDSHIATYNHSRRAMIRLGLLNDDDPQFPVLTVADTRMKSRQRKRAVGDSRRTDGVLFTIGNSKPAVVTSSPTVLDDTTTGKLWYVPSSST